MTASTVFQSRPGNQLASSSAASVALSSGVSAPEAIGKYRVVRTIGAGAMGIVYECWQTDLERRVAVKVMRPRGAGTVAQAAEQVKRFEREARSAARLSHPHVVQIFDVGRHEGLHYIVMEYVEGKPLHELVGTSYLTLPNTLRILHHTALALGAAHEQGVIHRDLKPSNILVDRAGRPRIADFGLAKSVSDELSLSREGDLVGTPRYMSPEQIVSPTDDLDGRSDLFSLGAVMFEMLAGRPAFDGPTMLATLQQVVDAPTPSLAEHAPDAPLAVARICERALAKERDDRYASAPAMAADLREALVALASAQGSRDGLTAEKVVQAFEPAPISSGSKGAASLASETSSARRLGLAGLAAGILLVALFGGWKLFASKGGDANPATPAVDYKALRQDLIKTAREQLAGPLKVAQTSSPRDGWKAVIEDLTVILKQSPDDLESLKLRGRALRRAGESLASIADFSAVLEKDPADREARVERLLANYQLYVLYLGNLNEPQLRPQPSAQLAGDAAALKLAKDSRFAEARWAAEAAEALAGQKLEAAEAIADRRPADAKGFYPPDLAMLEADLLLRAADARSWEGPEEREESEESEESEEEATSPRLTPSQRLGAKANRALRRGLDADPNHVGLLFLKANSLQQRTAWEDTEGEGREALFRRARPQFDSTCDRLRLATLRTGCDTAIARAVLLANVGWSLPALDQVQEGLSCRPTVPQLYAWKAWLRLQNPEDGTLTSEAVERIARDLEPASEASSEDFAAPFVAALLKIADGHWEDARRDLRLASRAAGPKGMQGLSDRHRRWLASSNESFTVFLDETREMLDELPVRQELRSGISEAILARLDDADSLSQEGLDAEHVRSLRAWNHYALAEAYAADDDRGDVLEQIRAALGVGDPEVTPQSFRDNGTFSGWNEDAEFVALYDEFAPIEPPAPEEDSEQGTADSGQPEDTEAAEDNGQIADADSAEATSE